MATAAFLNAWRTATARPLLLVKVELVGRTVYLSSENLTTPDGRTWETILGSRDQIHARSALLAPGPELVGWSFTMVTRKLAFQAVGKTLADAFVDFSWEGRKVTTYFWVRGLSSQTDLTPVYFGRVNRVVVEPGKATVYCIQRRDANRRIPPKNVNPTDYPNAPSATTVPLPVIYGDHSARVLRGEWAQSPNSRQVIDLHTGGGAAYGLVPGVVVNKGDGTDKPRILFAGHALKLVTGSKAGTPLNQILLDDGSLPSLVDQIESGDIQTGGGPALIASGTDIGKGIDVPINPRIGRSWLPVLPTDVRYDGANATTATTARNAIDPVDETSYAYLIAGGGFNRLTLPIPLTTPPGDFENSTSYIVVCYAGSALSAAYANVIFTTAEIPAATFPVALRLALNSPGTNNRTGGTDFVLTCPSGATRVFLVYLSIPYRPNRSLVLQALTIRAAAVTYDLSGRRVTGQPIRAGELRTGRFGPRDIVPSVYGFDGAFYANPKGYADDGSGTFTGVALAVIERAPDIARHVLVTYGGQVNAVDIEVGVGVFGSFVDARAIIRHSQKEDWVMSVHIGEQRALFDVLSDLAQQSASLFFLDRFSDRFVWVPWTSGQATSLHDYPVKFTEDMLLDLSAEVTTDTEIAQDIRVQYWQDYRLNKTLLETAISSSASSAGYTTPSARDQLQVVDGSNNKFDITSGGLKSYTIPSGTHAPLGTIAAPGLGILLRNFLRGATGLNTVAVQAGWGFEIVAGYNDRLQTSSNLTTLAPGRYTGEQLAAHATALLAGSGYTVTYAPLTNLFTFVRTTTFTISQAALEHAATAWPVFGFYFFLLYQTAASSFTGENAIASERFWIATPDTGFQLNFYSQNPTINCAFLLGFPRIQTEPNSGFQQAPFMRGDRETRATAAESLYGVKPGRVVQATWLRDERMAQLYRNLLFDFFGEPKVKVTFSTTFCPDLQRGRVVQFDSTVDSMMKFPRPGSDGSWVGKKFRVLEVAQHAGPENWHQQVVAIEV